MCQRFVNDFVDKVIYEMNKDPHQYFLLFINYLGAKKLIDIVCTSKELPQKLYDSFHKCNDLWQYDPVHFCVMLKVRQDELNKIMNGPISDKLKNINNLDDCVDFINNFGLDLFKEIDRDVGLLNFFDEFGYRSGHLCLFKYDKLIAKLERNNVPHTYKWN
jgi:hypothetical protein